MFYFPPPPAASPLQAFDASGPLTAPTLILAGDSQAADAFNSGNLNADYLNRFAPWLLYATRRRYIFDPSQHLFATHGLTSAQWVTAWLAPCAAACAAARAAGSTPVVVLPLGTNDCGSGSAPPSFAAIKANFETIFTTLHAAGAIVCPLLILPRAGVSALSSNGEKLRHGVNAYFSGLRRQPSRRVVPIDIIPAVTNGDGAPIAGYLQDGLHPTPTGAKAIAALIARVLDALCPFDGLQDFLAPTDVYDATYAPLGNLLPSLTAGAGGTLASAQVTGAAPDAWTAGVYTDVQNLNTAGSHLTAALAATTSSQDIPNEPMLQVTFGGAASGEYFVLSPKAQIIDGYAAGDVLQMGFTVEWDASLANIAAVGCMANLWYNPIGFEGQSGDGVTPLPAGPQRLAVTTEPLTLPNPYSNAAVLPRVFFAAGTGGAPGGVARVGQLWLRKIGPF